MTDRQLFDALPAHIEAALRDSIEEFGVLVPVFVDQDGNVIDGHHRSRIATDLGIDFATVTVEVASEEHALRIAHTLNADRRQLSTAQRLRAAARLRERGHSYRAIGEALGTSHTQAKRDASAAGVTDVPPASRGRDGKTYPAARPASERKETAAEATAAAVGGIRVSRQLEDALLESAAAHERESASSPTEAYERSSEGQDRAYVRAYLKALGQALAPNRFDPERLGMLLSPDEAEQVEIVAAGARRHADAVKRARTGLRAIEGGRR